MGSGIPGRHPRRLSVGGLSGLAWGDGPPALVTLHGALLSARAWDLVLATMPVDALALDQPGHGESAWYDDGDYGYARVAADVIAAIREVATTPVTLVGHSRGGLIASWVAALAPDLVRRLVTVDADPTRVRRVDGRPRMRWSGTLDELVDDAARMRPDLSRERVADGVRRGAVEQPDGTWAWRWDPKIAESPDDAVENTRMLARVRCPVAVIRGAESPAITEASVERITAALGRDIELITVPGGHNPHSEAPDELRRALTALLAV